MHEVCLEAKAYGDALLPVTAKPRHVTVILNPAANDGKCRAMFDKYCGPLLNLAGLKVGIIKTEKEGQAKDIMELMDNTDAVIVAGGDGTVAEVVTGLLRRSDRAQAVQRLPLALIPLGETSSSAAALLAPGEDSAARRITQATMALVRDTVRQLDVMEVQALETDAEVPGRPVYLLSNITWGAFRDVQARVKNYWYWGGLDQRVAYVFGIFKSLSWSCNADLEYTLHCSGCSRCHAEKQQQQQEQQAADQQQQQQARGGRWWSRFIPTPRPAVAPPTEEEPAEDFSAVDNPACGVWQRRAVSTVDLSLRTRHMATDGAAPGLHLRLGPEEMSSSEFISEGWSRTGGAEPSGIERLTVDQVRLVPALQERSATVTSNATTDSTADSTADSTTESTSLSATPTTITDSTIPTTTDSTTDSTAPAIIPVITDSTIPTTADSAYPTVIPTTTDSAFPTVIPTTTDSTTVIPTTTDSATPTVIPTTTDSTTPTVIPTTTEPAASTTEPAANSRWFGFDGEEFEVRPVLVRLLPRAVRVFTESRPAERS